ncbi:MAG: histidinol dehydrogenase [Candidatus Bathyarchaeia archaeon]
MEKRWPRAKKIDLGIAASVKPIIDEVRKRGDEALFEFTMKFDCVKLTSKGLCVSREEIERAYKKVDEEQISAVKFAKNRVETLEKDLLARIIYEYEYEGIRIRRDIRPFQSVGCYVPGGGAAYPSTLIMTVVPAKVAGVPRIVVCSPPKKGGEINPLTLVAADVSGVDEIYRVGGAQAVAALAYGTETIKPVEKIVGPGNIFVQTAKMLVSQDVPIDLVAGPSEILILADESANPRTVALDMISQAEHGVDSVLILVTTSTKFARNTIKELERILMSVPNKETVAQTLLRNGLVLKSNNVEEAVAFINEFAPEHLEIRTENAKDIAQKITSAGLILLGEYTPVSASDYCLGTNHVLPTGGFSRIFSGLSVLDFIKRVNVVECSKEGLLMIKNSIRTLAESEGLMNHTLAAEGRFQE